MVFSSLTFLFFFFPLTLILCFAGKGIKWRNGVLLAASLIFYAWGEPVWVLAMVGSSLVNFLCAKKIVHTKDKRARKMWMILGVSVSAAILFAFKYAAFFINSFLALFGARARVPALELPIGISFYTFQVITYTVDVYRRKTRAQKYFSRLLLYVSCFPQLIAGPIVQYSDIASQIGKRETTPDGFAAGMQRFVIGLGKKVIFANICGAALSSMPLAGGGAALSVGGAWYAALLYTLQIYFDFSGYSDMAIGIGRILGFSYKENFMYPYASKSVREFWRRWHISLGSFFRDYVYIPLGGNRKGLKRTILNTLIVWMLTGLWHGANWTFVAWGLFYGALLTLDLLFMRRVTDRLPSAINWVATMALVMVGWVIFYYPSLPQAFEHIGAMFGAGAGGLMDAASLRVIKTYSFFPLIAFVASLPVAPLIGKWASALPGRRAEAGRVVWLSVCLALSVLFLVGQSYNPFIYFQF
ncbi:MAG: MBOAT family protein [Clostridia bacterium]|nr:MBOAT family protein [Clostridia bacterium]MBO4885226.1 MBOAT family protein [Clostridia bacterium]